MNAHIPTIFFAVIVVSFVLAGIIAGVRHCRKPELMLWIGALTLHSIAYTLFSLRGEISEFLSIIVANILISSTLAILAEGILRFLERQPPRLLIWSPVMLTAIGFTLLIDNFPLRYIFGSLIFGLQGLFLLYLFFQSRREIVGQGKYMVAASIVLFLFMMLMQIVVAAIGQVDGTTITTSNPINTASFTITLICIIVLVIGLLLMTSERDDQTIKESEVRMRTLFENTSDAVIILDDHGFLDCNAATLKIFGCPSMQVFVTKKAADLSPAIQPCGTDSSTLAKQQVEKAMRESSNRFEWVHRRLDTNQTFPAEVLLNSMHIHGKHVLQAVVRDITERKQFQLELERQAHLDYLTGLHNRRFFMQVAETELARAIRYSAPLSLLMMDVDHFKLINDTYGHKAGDRVLKKISETCQKTLREIDIIGRVGGEEFAVLLPETDIDEAMDVAERLREEIAKAKVEIDQVLPLNFTISIGVTTLTPQNENIEGLLNVADKALYVAKDSGRNRVVRSAEHQLEV